MISDYEGKSGHNDLNFLMYFGYGVLAFMNYTLTTYYVKIAGAAAYNLNGLANTIWTMLADYFIFN